MSNREEKKYRFQTYKRIHCLPIDDAVKHIESEMCWCNPDVLENGRLIIHNSFDGREDFEEIEQTQ